MRRTQPITLGPKFFNNPLATIDTTRSKDKTPVMVIVVIIDNDYNLLYKEDFDLYYNGRDHGLIKKDKIINNI